MSRSFFAPDAGQSSSSSSSDTRLYMGGGGGGGGNAGAGTQTPDYGRASPSPPPGNRDEVKTPFLNSNGRAEDLEAVKTHRMPRSASYSAPGSSGESLAGLKALPPILSYCSASILMTVINKFVLSGAHFSMNLLMLLIQSVVGVLCVIAANKIGWIELRPWSNKDARNWAPISTLLVLTIWTGSKALQYLNIPVYTIFKNLTIILIAYGEVIWFGGRVTMLVFFSFALMVLSSVIAAWSDVARALAISQMSMPHTPDSILGGASFDPQSGHAIGAFDALGEEKDRLNALAGAGGMGDVPGHDEILDGLSGWGVLNSGYMWMALNCVVSAAYVLIMRKRIKLTGFKDWDTMYYNNLLSVPVLLIMSFLVEDWSAANWTVNFPQETRTRLLSAIVFSGACAVFIGYTTAWCVRTTSSTTYSMVGALNKLPLAISGMVFFHDPPVTLGSTSAIGVGFGAGVVYAVAKNQQAKAAKKVSESLATGTSLAVGGSDVGSESKRDGEIPLYRMDSERDRRKD